MSKPKPQRADRKGRITIPALAGALVRVIQVSAIEFRIRKIESEDEKDIEFMEERPIVLSARDSELFLAALDRPPRKPNAALRKAIRDYKRRHGE